MAGNLGGSGGSRTPPPPSYHPNDTPGGPGMGKIPGMQEFLDMLAQQNPEFQRVADELRAISQGTDPRFAEYQEGQFNVLRQNELAQLGQTADFFTRRGGGNSTAALNQLNRVSGGFDTQRGALSGLLGMQQMRRQDQARTGQLDVLSDMLQNNLAEPTLNIGWLAAQNAGGDEDERNDDYWDDYFEQHPEDKPFT